MNKAESLSIAETGNAFSDQDVLEQLQKILNSSLFVSSPRLQQMLDYIVRQKVDGQSDRIKGVTIAQDVFGRTDPEDAQTSTIVSVEARRLRRRLDDYYAELGSGDVIEISVPKGAFVPEFTQRLLSTNPARSISRKQSVRIQFFLVAIFLTVAATVVFFTISRTNPLQPTNLKPSIAVLPFRASTGLSGGAELAAGLTEDLITDLSTLPEIEVIAYSSVVLLPHSEMRPSEVEQHLGVSHVLRGSLRGVPKNLRVTAELTDAKTQELIWAHRFDAGGNDILRLQDDISRKVLGSLSIPFEGLRSLQHDSKGAPSMEVMALFKQAMDIANPPSDPARLELAEAAFQSVIDADPTFAGGYAGKAYIGSFRAKFGHADNPKELAQRSAELASAALELDPNSALAHHAMAFSQLVLGDFSAALTSSEKAVSVEPNDPYAQTYHGFLLAADGRADEGLLYAERALRLDPLDPRTPYLNILGVVQFQVGNYQDALQSFLQSRQRGGPVSQGNSAHLAATYVALGNKNEARRILSELPDGYVEGSWTSWRHRSFRLHEDAERALGFIRQVE